MKLERQQVGNITLENFDEYAGAGFGEGKKTRHGPLLPNKIRCIICGPSNCGKTNVLFNLLFSPDGFLVVDKESDIDGGRYRVGFDVFVKEISR